MSDKVAQRNVLRNSPDSFGNSCVSWKIGLSDTHCVTYWFTDDDDGSGSVAVAAGGGYVWDWFGR